MAKIKILEDGRYDLITEDPALEDESTDCYIFQIMTLEDIPFRSRERIRMLMLETFDKDFYDLEEDETHSLSMVSLNNIEGKNGCTKLTLNMEFDEDPDTCLEGLLIGENEELFFKYLNFFSLLQSVTKDRFIIWYEERGVPEIAGWKITHKGMSPCANHGVLDPKGNIPISKYLIDQDLMDQMIEKAKKFAENDSDDLHNFLGDV